MLDAFYRLDNFHPLHHLHHNRTISQKGQKLRTTNRKLVPNIMCHSTLTKYSCSHCIFNHWYCDPQIILYASEQHMTGHTPSSPPNTPICTTAWAGTNVFTTTARVHRNKHSSTTELAVSSAVYAVSQADTLSGALDGGEMARKMSIYGGI